MSNESRWTRDSVLHVAAWGLVLVSLGVLLYATRHGLVPHAYVGGILAGQGIGFFYVLRDRKHRTDPTDQ